MKILRIKDVIRITGLSRTTLWRLERANNFPARIELSPNRCVGYRSDEVEAWIESRPRAAGQSTSAVQGVEK